MTVFLDKIQTLLERSLDFHNVKDNNKIHSIHSFAAKFPPSLPRHFIEGLTSPGDTVLDPMAGSGVTLVESLRSGRHAIGADIDPLAIRLCVAKTAQVDPEALMEAGQRVVDEALLATRLGKPLQIFRERLDDPTRAFLDYWFRVDTQRELAALALALEHETRSAVRTVLEVVLSSTIVTKSGGVSLARDLAHSRPHRDTGKKVRSALSSFQASLSRIIDVLRELNGINSTKSHVCLADARDLPIQSSTIDLIVTSPPYANAIDYMRAHKFSLVWLGYRIEELSRRRGTYIGAERRVEIETNELPPSTLDVLKPLEERDRGRARVLERYFCEMAAAISEMYRVLRPGGAAVMVVGPSLVRGIQVQTHRLLCDIALQKGFQVAGMAKRSLDRNRRMMPATLGGNSRSTIEKRIHEEFVIGLVKD